jgi:hypothetical protein
LFAAKDQRDEGARPEADPLPRSGEDGKDVLSRSNISVLSADAIVALPGGLGHNRRSTWRGHYGAALIACGQLGFAGIEHATGIGGYVNSS